MDYDGTVVNDICKLIKLGLIDDAVIVTKKAISSGEITNAMLRVQNRELKNKIKNYRMLSFCLLLLFLGSLSAFLVK